MFILGLAPISWRLASEKAEFTLTAKKLLPWETGNLLGFACVHTHHLLPYP